MKGLLQNDKKPHAQTQSFGENFNTPQKVKVDQKSMGNVQHPLSFFCLQVEFFDGKLWSDHGHIGSHTWFCSYLDIGKVTPQMFRKRGIIKGILILDLPGPVSS